jgi:hypothetical protein
MTTALQRLITSGARLNRLLAGFLAVAMMLIVANVLRADPIEISVVTTDAGTPLNQIVKSRTLINSVDSLVKQQGDFTGFAGRSTVARLTYLGVPNAMILTSNAAATTVNLQIPAIGFSKTFSGATPNIVEQQIEDFLKKDGAATYAAFQQSINEASTAAPLDGNPQAVTAWLNSGAFERFAFSPIVSDETKEVGAGGAFNLRTNGAYGSTDGGNLTTVDLTLEGGARFGDTVALTWAIPIGWHSVDGADVYMGGFEMGLPITIVKPQRPTKDFSVSWRLSPFGQGGVGASEDLVAGGIIVGGGVVSAVNLRYKSTTFIIGNQASYYHGFDVGYSSYQFDTNVEQIMLRNGVKVVQSFGRDGGFIDAGFAYTNFLKNASTDEYISPTFGIGKRWGDTRASGIRVAYQGDFGNRYTTNGASILLFASW